LCVIAWYIKKICVPYLLQNSLTTLDQKDWTIVNSNSFWVIWLLRMEMYCTIHKYSGRVEGECLKVCTI
jgi:hypothetical protein